MSFTTVVKEIVRTIPRGETMSYSEVAAKADNPKAARAVANIMAKNFDLDIPCHRVIKSDGTLGGYNRGGVKVKKSLLASEGAVL
jgi:O-6-methylguanine DNA methyltransferase